MGNPVAALWWEYEANLGVPAVRELAKADRASSTTRVTIWEADRRASAITVRCSKKYCDLFWLDISVHAALECRMHLTASSSQLVVRCAHCIDDYLNWRSLLELKMRCNWMGKMQDTLDHRKTSNLSVFVENIELETIMDLERIKWPPSVWADGTSLLDSIIWCQMLRQKWNRNTWTMWRF